MCADSHVGDAQELAAEELREMVVFPLSPSLKLSRQSLVHMLAVDPAAPTVDERWVVDELLRR